MAWVVCPDNGTDRFAGKPDREYRLAGIGMGQWSDRCKEPGDWQRSNRPRMSRVLMVHGLNTHAHLTKIVEASPCLGTREGRQEHACQNGDDGNDHQEFDQGEGLGPWEDEVSARVAGRTWTNHPPARLILQSACVIVERGCNA